MPDPLAVTKTVLDAGGLAWEHRGRLAKALSVLRSWFRRNSRILIIGPGGTGKTTLSRILSGEFDWLADTPWKYEESYTVDRIRLPKRNAEAIIAPGQKLRRKPTWAALKADLAAGKFRGVILVSAFGYHSLGGKASLAVLRPGKKRDVAIQELLAEGRADELAILRDLSGAIRLSPKKLWLLSLVTKQDLWLADEADVRAFYSDGEYAEAIRELEAARGDRFYHEIAFASLVIGNWMAGGERLKKNAEGYDHELQVTSVRRVFDLLDGLRQWEK